MSPAQRVESFQERCFPKVVLFEDAVGIRGPGALGWSRTKAILYTMGKVLVNRDGKAFTSHVIVQRFHKSAAKVLGPWIGTLQKMEKGFFFMAIMALIRLVIITFGEFAVCGEFSMDHFYKLCMGAALEGTNCSLKHHPIDRIRLLSIPVMTGGKVVLIGRQRKGFPNDSVVVSVD